MGMKPKFSGIAAGLLAGMLVGAATLLEAQAATQRRMRRGI